MTWDDLIVNGTSLSSIGVIEDFSGIAKTPPLRGANVTIPYAPGESFTPKVPAAYDFLVPLALLATDHGGRMQSLSDLTTLMTSAATTALALTRRITVGVTQLSQTALGDYVSGLDPVFVGTTAARVPLLIRNLSGGWA